MRRIAGLLALTSAIGIAQAAEMPHLFNNNEVGVLLSDEVLGAQRGKFVSANSQAHYFGIEFITTISGPNNTMITNGMQLNVNFNRTQPVSVNTYSSENSLTSTSVGIAPNSSLPNGSGVVQVAQVSGNGNMGVNDFMFVPGQMTVKGSALTQNHYQLSLPNGIGTVRYDVGGSGLGMSYASQDGHVTSAQMLRNSNGNQGFVQQFSIADNNKLLSNQAKFYMGDKLGAYTDLANTLKQQLPMGIKL
ncbi:hypothetical protein [Oceanisphaera ostreae]|uniref:Uncharacterized protein n=1 Tax=Oceanisphaera ostreae TaxID=914151 RepID=A0ABW3KCU9_9GAMM